MVITRFKFLFFIRSIGGIQPFVSENKVCVFLIFLTITVITFFLGSGFFKLDPNEAAIFRLLGNYKGR
jgi:hypothetical protein